MRRSHLRLLGFVLPLVLLPAAASAATWGSFSATRMAYATGPLTGDVHFELRSYIDDQGDALAPPTDELTPEYLATVDVFYTAMLSDGTGPTAGALGTLSLPEQAALQDFVAAGGTVIVTPDSNGFDGPYPLVWDSWLQDYGVTDFAFVFGPGVGMTAIAHPITENVGAFELDGTVTFTYPIEGQALATTIGAEVLMVVFEPASGFLEGGRLLVLADHNALTDAFVANNGNEVLARNIVAWASAQCGNSTVEASEECDDGNTEDGDGCDATCALEDGGSGSDSGGLDGTAGSSSGPPGNETGAPASTGEDEGASSTGQGQSDDSSGAPLDGTDDGCGCRTERRSPGLAGLLLLLGVGLTRRRRAGRSTSRAHAPPMPRRAARSSSNASSRASSSR